MSTRIIWVCPYCETANFSKFKKEVLLKYQYKNVFLTDCPNCDQKIRLVISIDVEGAFEDVPVGEGIH